MYESLCSLKVQELRLSIFVLGYERKDRTMEEEERNIGSETVPASSPVESKSVIKKNNINDKRISLLIRELSK
jgi:hypothetical protein|tara:strand:+ start:308 stop:526 length:219 start_codon:yes stop_codon:yes gene_type:complete